MQEPRSKAQGPELETPSTMMALEQKGQCPNRVAADLVWITGTSHKSCPDLDSDVGTEPNILVWPVPPVGPWNKPRSMSGPAQFQGFMGTETQQVTAPVGWSRLRTSLPGSWSPGEGSRYGGEGGGQTDDPPTHPRN